MSDQKIGPPTPVTWSPDYKSAASAAPDRDVVVQLQEASPWAPRNYYATDTFCDFVRRVGDFFVLAVVTQTQKSSGQWYWTGGTDVRGHVQGTAPTADEAKRQCDEALRERGWKLADSSAKEQNAALLAEVVELRHIVEQDEAWKKQAKAAEAAKDSAYHERDQCVALIARMAVSLGYQAGLGRHVGDPWDDDWRTIVFVDLPAGQVSWHIHDSERDLFDFLGPYDDEWDGHTTPEKYERCQQPVANPADKCAERCDVASDLEDARAKCERMRAVVETAKVIRDNEARLFNDHTAEMLASLREALRAYENKASLP